MKQYKCGLDSTFFIVYMGQTARTEEGYAEAKKLAMHKFDAIHRMTEIYPEQISFAYTPQEARDIYASS